MSTYINFRFKNVFLCNRFSDRSKTLSIGGTPYGEYFIDNPHVISHMVWQLYGIKEKKNLTSSSLKLLNEKNENWHVINSPCGVQGDNDDVISEVVFQP